MKKLLFILSPITFLSLISCSKHEGFGGKAEIYGKVFVNDYDNETSNVIGSQYAAGERVFITFGDDNNTFDHDVRTSFDGSFKFDALKSGQYKVTVLSLDTNNKAKGNDSFIPVIKLVKISDKKQRITLDDFVVNR